MKNELAPPMMESRNPHNLRNFQEFASHRRKQSAWSEDAQLPISTTLVSFV